ncbi:MAG: xanthine dehydrogenase accessory protein XdhC [Beijerinckiaceae bacterium]
MKQSQALASALNAAELQGEAVASITIVAVEGSAPRDAGTVMIVTSSQFAGTIGGGRLEWDAIAEARAMLKSGENLRELDVVLGPAIGQCCGGRVKLRLERLSPEAAAALIASEEAVKRPAVFIYGAGHVGRALATAMAPLPFAVSLVDSRADEMALFDGAGIHCCLTDKPLSIAENAPAGSAHVVMTHSHALDSLIAAAVLEQNQFGYLGIIGSRTKRNSFRKAFREIGIPAECIARVVCPIGGSTVKDKRPEVIATLVAAEIVTVMLT